MWNINSDLIIRTWSWSLLYTTEVVRSAKPCSLLCSTQSVSKIRLREIGDLHVVKSTSLAQESLENFENINCNILLVRDVQGWKRADY